MKPILEQKWEVQKQCDENDLCFIEIVDEQGLRVFSLDLSDSDTSYNEALEICNQTASLHNSSLGACEWRLIPGEYYDSWTTSCGAQYPFIENGPLLNSECKTCIKCAQSITPITAR